MVTNADITIVKAVDKTGKASKVPVWQGVFAYFSQALLAIAAISKFGSVKHNNGNFPTTWKDNPATTYADALGRHIMAEGKDGLYDPESGKLHAAHAAWNAVARLELLLNDNPIDKPAEAKVIENLRVAFVERRVSSKRRIALLAIPLVSKRDSKPGRRADD